MKLHYTRAIRNGNGAGQGWSSPPCFMPYLGLPHPIPTPFPDYREARQGFPTSASQSLMGSSGMGVCTIKPSTKPTPSSPISDPQLNKVQRLINQIRFGEGNLLIEFIDEARQHPDDGQLRIGQFANLKERDKPAMLL